MGKRSRRRGETRDEGRTARPPTAEPASDGAPGAATDEPAPEGAPAPAASPLASDGRLHQAQLLIEEADHLGHLYRWIVLAGEVPRAQDWLRREDWPHPDDVIHVFGSWEKFLQHAQVPESRLLARLRTAEDAARAAGAREERAERELARVEDLRRQAETARRRREAAEAERQEAAARAERLAGQLERAEARAAARRGAPGRAPPAGRREPAAARGRLGRVARRPRGARGRARGRPRPPRGAAARGRGGARGGRAGGPDDRPPLRRAGGGAPARGRRRAGRRRGGARQRPRGRRPRRRRGARAALHARRPRLRAGQPVPPARPTSSTRCGAWTASPSSTPTRPGSGRR